MSEFGNPEGYELWMGRWSRGIAGDFLTFADLPMDGHFLDVGCGTGALTTALIDTGGRRTVVGVEPSTDYVALCRDRLQDERLRFETGDATDIPFAPETFDATVSLLILQEIPDAAAAVREMHRVTRPGGTVATCQWRFSDGFPMLRLFWDSVLETVGGSDLERLERSVMAVDYPDDAALSRLWRDSGFVDVETGALETTMRFESFEDYWTPFLSDVTDTSSVAGSLEDEARRALEAALCKRVLGGRTDGAFELPAGAWAVRGRVAE